MDTADLTFGPGHDRRIGGTDLRRALALADQDNAVREGPSSRPAQP
jgi:hypothetical protein